ncbi:MAG: AtpZ/AtpI family protein [Armatimonadetes bacterium]|nr:AtpZ/AtpI family protein [Armatimonadota bacterium]
MRIAKDGRRFAKVLDLASLGIVMGVCVGIGMGAGLLLDRRLGTEPWLAVVGLILGSVAAFKQLIRAVSESSRGQDG